VPLRQHNENEGRKQTAAFQRPMAHEKLVSDSLPACATKSAGVHPDAHFRVCPRKGIKVDDSGQSQD
jgi:hypothetical protein